MFLFFRSRVLTERHGIGQGWNNNKPLRGCSQAKIMPSRAKKSVKFLACLSRSPPYTPQQTHRVCVLEVSFDYPKQLDYIIIMKEPHLSIRLGRFFGVSSARPSWPNSMGGLWRKRISYAVISCNRWPHQNHVPGLMNFD